MLDGADRNCGERIAFFLFSGLNTMQVFFLWKKSPKNFGHMQGRTDWNFLIFILLFFHLFPFLTLFSFPLTVSHSSSFSHSSRSQPYLTLPYLTLPYLTLPYLTLPYLTLPYLTFLLLSLSPFKKRASRFSTDFCAEKFLPTKKTEHFKVSPNV